MSRNLQAKSQTSQRLRRSNAQQSFCDVGVCDVDALLPPACSPSAEDLPFLQQQLDNNNSSHLTSPAAFHQRCLLMLGSIQTIEQAIENAQNARDMMREALARPDGEVAQIIQEMGWPNSPHGIEAIQT